MPPRTFATTTIDRATLATRTGPAVQALLSPPPTLLGPGRYELRNVLVNGPGPVGAWSANPVVGGVHVTWDGTAYTESWVLAPGYHPAGADATGGAPGLTHGVVITCVHAGPPPALSTWLATAGPPGSVLTSWSHPSPPANRANRRIPNPPRKEEAQCAPGDVEIWSTDAAGSLLARRGFVWVRELVAGGTWQAGSYQEDWYLGANPPLALGQSALLRKATVIPPLGTPTSVWFVSYQTL